MRTQQQAEREEQQRIKNLVLNYDLGDDNEPNDGEADNFPSLSFRITRNHILKYTKATKNDHRPDPKRPAPTEVSVPVSCNLATLIGSDRIGQTWFIRTEESFWSLQL